MNFTLYKVNDSRSLKGLGINKISFFKKQEDIEIFHFNEIEKDMFHIVYHIKDEYQVGTRRVGNQMNLPFTQFINCFFFLQNEYFLLEEVLKQYQKDVLTHIEKKAHVSIQPFILNNNHFLNLYTSLGGFIKKLEYIDEDEDDVYFNSVTREAFVNIINSGNTIDRMTLSVEDQFVSIYQSGKVAVDNSDEKFLIKFTKEIVNALNSPN